METQIKTEVKTPSQEELMTALVNAVKERDEKIKEQEETIKTIEQELESSIECCKQYEAELEKLRQELYKPCQATEVNNVGEKLSIPWGDKIENLFFQLQREENYYINKIRDLKLSLIDYPEDKALLKKKLKCNIARLKKMRRLLKVCVR